MQTCQPTHQTHYITMEQIIPRREGAFEREESTSLGELAASIRKNGMIQAITVRATPDGRYVIISGNRRFWACRMLGLRTIEAVILPEQTGDGAAARLAHLASGQLYFLEAAEVTRELVNEYGMGREALALRLRCSESTIRNRLKLARLDEAVCRVIREEDLSERMALTLTRIADPAQCLRVARRAVAERLSIRDVELLAASVQTSTAQRPQRTGRTITVVRDSRLYLNALRTIAAQMQEAGFRAEITESQTDHALTVSVSVSTRRRRSDRYRRGSSQQVQWTS